MIGEATDGRVHGRSRRAPRPTLGTLVLAAVLAGFAGAAAADDALNEARRLFTAGRYDRTLDALARVEDPAELDTADEYRALSLLALDREEEAGQVMERLVLRNPLQPPSPRLPARFGEVYRQTRHRLVPRLAQASYVAAKGSLGSRDFDAAVRQFEETLELIRSAEDRAALADLELVATEFRVLAQQRQRTDLQRAAPPLVPAEQVVPALALDPGWLPELRAEAPPIRPVVPDLGAVERPVADAVAHGPAPFSPINRIHDATDGDVEPPAVIRQSLPAWNPPWKQVRARNYTGRLAIVVGEDGTVVSADILQESFASYDDELLRAVAEWRYEPARKRDRPVKYRRVIEFVLRGDSDLARR
ncbi:MAG: energy transducer TonB [Vicinamibacterales bacterium]